MKLVAKIRDDNGNEASFSTDDQASIEALVMYVAAAAKSEGFERFKSDGAVVVQDAEGNEIARADSRSNWSLPALASSFPLDELNPGWVKGWGVVRMAPWDFAGLFLTRKLADNELAARGADYVVGYGSRRLGSNDFVFD